MRERKRDVQYELALRPRGYRNRPWNSHQTEASDQLQPAHTLTADKERLTNIEQEVSLNMVVKRRIPLRKNISSGRLQCKFSYDKNYCNKVHKKRITQTVQFSLQIRWTHLVVIVPRHKKKKQDRKAHSVQLLRGNIPAASTEATTAGTN